MLRMGRLVLRQATLFVFLAAAARAAIVTSGLGHGGRLHAEEDASFVRNSPRRCQIPRSPARHRSRSRRRGSRRRMRALRRLSALGLFPTQAEGPAVPPRPRARPAFQLLLRGRWMPRARDAGIGPLPRPSRFHRRGRRADHHPATGHHGRAAGRARPSRSRRPPHRRALAPLVARHVHRDAVLGSGARRVHAAGRARPASGIAARTLRRRDRGRDGSRRPLSRANREATIHGDCQPLSTAGSASTSRAISVSTSWKSAASRKSR